MSLTPDARWECTTVVNLHTCGKTGAQQTEAQADAALSQHFLEEHPFHPSTQGQVWTPATVPAPVHT